MTDNIMQQHPVVPSPELLQHWYSMLPKLEFGDLVKQIYAAGADQELEACCEWIYNETSDDGFIAVLRAVRRPKPPSLKEQALAALERYEAEEWCEEMTFDSSVIRRALEQLEDN
jgi:hypothetical protein